MTFHAIGIVPGQHVRFVAVRDLFAPFKIIKDVFQCLSFFPVVSESLPVFFELSGKSQFPHESNDFIMDSSDDVSTIPAYSPREASSIAACVSALGVW